MSGFFINLRKYGLMVDHYLSSQIYHKFTDSASFRKLDIILLIWPSAWRAYCQVSLNFRMFLFLQYFFWYSSTNNPWTPTGCSCDPSASKPPSRHQAGEYSADREESSEALRLWLCPHYVKYVIENTNEVLWKSICETLLSFFKKKEQSHFK